MSLCRRLRRGAHASLRECSAVANSGFAFFCSVHCVVRCKRVQFLWISRKCLKCATCRPDRRRYSRDLALRSWLLHQEPQDRARLGWAAWGGPAAAHVVARPSPPRAAALAMDFSPGPRDNSTEGTQKKYNERIHKLASRLSGLQAPPIPNLSKSKLECFLMFSWCDHRKIRGSGLFSKTFQISS